jgi:hypothetical protein
MAAQPNTWPVRPIAAPCRARGCYCQLKLLVGRIDGLPTPGRTPRIDRRRCRPITSLLPLMYRSLLVPICKVTLTGCSYEFNTSTYTISRGIYWQVRERSMPTAEATMTMTTSPGLRPTNHATKKQSAYGRYVRMPVKLVRTTPRLLVAYSVFRRHW